jgi:hypothetical protein
VRAIVGSIKHARKLLEELLKGRKCIDCHTR